MSHAANASQRTFPASAPIAPGSTLTLVDLRPNSDPQYPQYPDAAIALQGLVNRKPRTPSIFVLFKPCLSAPAGSCDPNITPGGNELFWYQQIISMYGLNPAGATALLSEDQFIGANVRKYALDPASGSVRVVLYSNSGSLTCPEPTSQDPVQKNLAVTLAGAYDALPLEFCELPAFTQLLQSNGLTLTTSFSSQNFNLTGSPWLSAKDPTGAAYPNTRLGKYRWLWDLVNGQVTKDFFALEPGNISVQGVFTPRSFEPNIDYYVQNRAFVFEFSALEAGSSSTYEWDDPTYGQQAWVTSTILPAYAGSGFSLWKPVMGWFGLGAGEETTVDFLSANQKFTEPGDSNPNLTVYAGLPANAPFQQIASPRIANKTLSYDPAKTYVAWTFTQGDAIPFNIDVNVNYWMAQDGAGNPLRAQVPSSWMGNYFANELFPQVPKYLYSTQTSSNSFITGPGYMHPGQPTAADLQNWLSQKVQPSFATFDFHTVWVNDGNGGPGTPPPTCDVSSWPAQTMPMLAQWLATFGLAIDGFLIKNPFGSDPACSPSLVGGSNISVLPVSFTSPKVFTAQPSDLENTLATLNAQALAPGSGASHFLFVFMLPENPGLPFLGQVQAALADPTSANYNPNVVFVTADELAALEQQASGLAPSISAQPQSQTVLAGKSVKFSVVASGSPDPSYQWIFEHNPIRGATTASYVVSASAATAGDYHVEVSNPFGEVASRAASLTIATLPSVVTQPSSLTVTAGARAVLSVTAAGTGPLSYQWVHDHVAIPGATAPNYVIKSAATGDVGDYHVTISNALGQVSSSAANVVVNAPGN